MDYTLSNAELVLTLLIGESPGINGYTIRKRAEQRGLDAWAGVASSSIYNALKDLDGRGLATSSVDSDKQGRGPRGRSVELTELGRRALARNVTEALRSTRENDPRFNIALAGIEFIPASTAADCLAQRAAFLAAEADRLDAQSLQEPLPLSARLLFDRIIHAIRAERAWLEHAQGLITMNNAEGREH